MDGGKTIGKNRIDCSCFLSRGETERGEFPGIISPFTEMTGEDEQGARGGGGHCHSLYVSGGALQ